jgi:transcriptional regulator with XRE-family HTH domain
MNRKLPPGKAADTWPMSAAAHPVRMDGSRVGRVLRAVRRHLELTQDAVAARAGMSQSVYSRAENGELSGMTIGSLDRIAAALGATLFIDVRYQGGLGDRLVDAAHAALVEFVVDRLRGLGWRVELEFTFNVFGDRGSVDVLAWHPSTHSLLIIEVKSRFTDLQAMLVSLARKLRVVPGVARSVLEWDAVAVSRIVVVSGTAENRAIVRRHQATFDATLPARAVEIRRWLRAPRGPIAGIWLVSNDALASPGGHSR